MGTNSQSKVPQLVERGTWGFRDRRTEDTRIAGETGLLHREEEKERHIETGTTKDIDRLAMPAAAAVGIEAAIEAEAAAREEIDHHTMEVLPVEK